ncbi:MAG: fibronectin type III domain-containing protein [Elusimicrobiota bacterium]
MRRSWAVALSAAAWALLSHGAFVPASGAGVYVSSDSLTVTMRPRDVWPPAPVTDLVGVPGAEGQMLLQWTAPDSNSNNFASRTPAAGYQIRVASFSVFAVGGSTTAWWSLAADVRSLPSPAIGGNPPTPGPPGSLDTMLLTQLEPGVTMYALIISTDSLGLVSGADLRSYESAQSTKQAQALIYDAVPPAPASITATQVGPRSIQVSWPAVSAYDLDFYRLYIDSTPAQDFADESVIQIDSTTLSITLTNLSTGTYALRVSAVDKGQPSYGGVALESPASSSTTITLSPIVRAAQAPFGVSLSSAGAAITIRWMPVTRFADGVSFADPSNPQDDELNAYSVHRATSVVLGGWSQQTVVSSATLTWTDVAGGPQYYYRVRAENNTGSSEHSVIRSVGSLSAYVLAPDDRSYFELMIQSLSPIEGVSGQPMTAYLVQASSRAQDLGGRVVQSLDFSAKLGGVSLAPNYPIPGLGRMKLRYEMSGSSVSSAGAGLAVPATPNNLGIYWYDGGKWIQMFGKLDATEQTLNLETKYFGRYQLRVVERAESFAFNTAGVSNRFVTPNGDGKNDSVVFTFDNPHGAAVHGRILDMKGRVVVSDLPAGPIQNSLQWDGTAKGGPVPGGLYIYQLEGEGNVYTGTIVILK